MSAKFPSGEGEVSFFVWQSVCDGCVLICVVDFLVVAGMCKFIIDSLYIRLIGLF